MVLGLIIWKKSIDTLDFRKYFKLKRALSSENNQEDKPLMSVNPRLREEFIRILYDVMIIASFNKENVEHVDIQLMNRVLFNLSLDNLNQKWLKHRIMLHREEEISLDAVFGEFGSHLSEEQQNLVMKVCLLITRTEQTLSEANLTLLMDLSAYFSWQPSQLMDFIHAEQE